MNEGEKGMMRQAKFSRADRMKEDGLKFADSYYGEMAHYGLYRLATVKIRI
jgi:hypothetical protein